MDSQNADTFFRKSTVRLVHQLLHTMEQEHNVTVLFAIESGSRVWGFDSANSDYDVRFVYVHRPHAYHSIQTAPETLSDTWQRMDLVGWDIRKLAFLLSRNNVSAIEWAMSPIVYLDMYNSIYTVRDVANRIFNPFDVISHHMGLVYSRYNKAIKGREAIRIKDYLYILRSMYSILYVEQELSAPPLNIHELHSRLTHPPDWGMHHLVRVKKTHRETDTIGRSDVINDAIETFMDRRTDVKSKRRSDILEVCDSLTSLIREVDRLKPCADDM